MFSSPKINSQFRKPGPNRIVFVVTRSDTIGGVHTHIINVIKTLDKSKYSVHVIAGDSKNPLFFKKLDSLSIPYSINPYLVRNISPLKDILSIIWQIKFSIESKDTIFWAHSSKAGLVTRIAAFITLTPCIFTAHGWSFVAPKSKLIKSFYMVLEFLLCIISNKIITVSEFDYNLALLCHFPTNKVKLIHNYVHLPEIRANLTKKANNSTLIRFIMVARFAPQKDHLTVLKAFSLLSKQQNWELYFVGDGPLYDQARIISSELNLSEKIIFTGHLSEIDFYYSLCDVFILSSHWEGFPMTSLEAMSYSMPLIVSDVGGSKEVVIENYNGFTFYPGDYIRLNEIIQYFLNNPGLTYSMGSSSKLVYDLCFSEDIAADKIQETIEKAIN